MACDRVFSDIQVAIVRLRSLADSVGLRPAGRLGVVEGKGSGVAPGPPGILRRSRAPVRRSSPAAAAALLNLGRPLPLAGSEAELHGVVVFETVCADSPAGFARLMSASRKVLRLLLAFCAPVSWLSLLGSPAAAAAELDGALVGAVFAGDPALYASPAVDLSACARACRSAYLGALPQPVERDAGQTLRHPKRLLAARRDFVARQALGVAGGEGSDDARRFAQSLTLHIEWEGMSEPPLLEARQALQWAEENPTSPIAPVARLFAAHRYRAAYECAALAYDEAGAAAAAAA